MVYTAAPASVIAIKKLFFRFLSKYCTVVYNVCMYIELSDQLQIDQSNISLNSIVLLAIDLSKL